LTRSSYRFGRCKDSYLYRLRGDVLAKRDSNAAEAAYREALRVAREQDARTYGLQAAHALAKLYRSMNRATDAHAMLTPALEGFSPTSEFPEIEEAQKLLAALVETDEVKNAAASRQRKLKLQTIGSSTVLVQRLCCRGNKGRFYPRPRTRCRNCRCRRTIPNLLWRMGRGLLRGAVFEYLGKIKGIWRAVPATRLMVVKPCCSRLDL
jgi:hypothetical protein